MFDPNSILVSGMSLLVLVFGVVEVLKDWFSISGKVVTAISAGLGIVFYVIYSLIGILPNPYEQIVTIVFQAVAFGLAASGYYKFISQRTTKIS